jgi:hypothetical protein
MPGKQQLLSRKGAREAGLQASLYKSLSRIARLWKRIFTFAQEIFCTY